MVTLKSSAFFHAGETNIKYPYVSKDIGRLVNFDHKKIIHNLSSLKKRSTSPPPTVLLVFPQYKNYMSHVLHSIQQDLYRRNEMEPWYFLISSVFLNDGKKACVSGTPLLNVSNVVAREFVALNIFRTATISKNGTPYCTAFTRRNFFSCHPPCPPPLHSPNDLFFPRCLFICMFVVCASSKCSALLCLM